MNELLGIQTPRILYSPQGTTDAGQDAIDLAEAFGLILDPWQRLVLLEALKEREDGMWAANEVGLMVSRQNGKGPHALETPILTTDGWTTFAEISKGQEVYGIDGKPVKVVAVSEIYPDEECYRVSFTDGSSYVVGSGHLWRVKHKSRARWEVRSTAEIADSVGGIRSDNGRNEYNWRVDCSAVVDPARADLPIDPYLLGYWLGDGTSSAAAITVGHEDESWVTQRIQAAGASIVNRYTKDDDSGQAAHLHFRIDARMRDGFESRCRRLGIWGNKHIPDIYLNASPEQRKELLAGLLDSDGSIRLNTKSSQVEFSSSYPALAEGVQSLLRSLGIRVCPKVGETSYRDADGNKVKCRDRTRFLWTPTFNPFQMPRKAAGYVELVSNRQSLMSITSIERVPTVPVRCIQVDAEDGVYLVGRNFTPTHNSILEAVELSGLLLFGERLILHTAHEFKALAIDTPVFTESGWSTMGDLVDGDRVYGPDGLLTNVIAHPIRYERPCFKLTFDDGQSVVADEDHLWPVYDTVSRSERVMTVRELVDGGVYQTRRNAGRADSKIYRFRVPITQPLAGAEVALPVDPYLLGYWLGDGDTAGGRFTVGEEDVEHFRGVLTSQDYEFSDYVDPRTGAHTITPYGFRTELRRAEILGAKSIPDVYFTASAEQRLALLAGILDSDGGVTGHQISVTMKHEQLMRQVLMLARSLGYKSFFTSHLSMMNGEHKARVFRVKFANRQKVNPFRLPRKAAKVMPPLDHITRSQYNAIVSIEQVESVPTRCITVDNDSSLYVVGHGFVPTHNTAKEAMRRLDLLLTAHGSKYGVKHKTSSTNGLEGIEIIGGANHGARVMFQTRTKGAGLGLSADRVICDEAMIISPEAIQALMFTTSARPNTQMWYTGSAVDQRIHIGCEVFGGVRARAMKQIGKRLCYIEWSAKEDDDPAKIETAAKANPALGRRISVEDVESEFESFNAMNNMRAYGVQRLGVGDWPELGETRSEIPKDKWIAFKELSPKFDGPWVTTLYRAPEGGPWAIAAARRTLEIHKDDLGRDFPVSRVHLEVGYAGNDPEDAVVEKFVQVAQEWGPVATIVGRGAADAVTPKLEAAGLNPVTPNLMDEAQACGGLLNDVFAKTPILSHGNRANLNTAVSSAVKKELPSGGFVWENVSENTYPLLMAATLARWGLAKFGNVPVLDSLVAAPPSDEELDSWLSGDLNDWLNE